MLSWVTLRLLQLLQLQPLYAAETTLEFAHLIALVTLLAPFKSFVEYAWTSCRASHGLKRFKVGLLRREPEPLLSPASESNEAPAGEGRTIACETAAPVTRNEGSTGQSRLRYRRRMDLTAPLHLNFYLDTVWYVEALPIAGMSALAQVVLMVALAITGKDPTTVVVLQLVPWYVLFTPVQVLLFVLCAMITEERGGTTGSKKKIYWGLSAMFGLISIVAALDTIYGIGGIPMSYISMATTGLMIIAYALYGCISKPGKHVKGKGTNSGEIDEESALLGSKVQVRIPIRRPKYLHGPSRRLSKQSIKNYGTMAAKPLGGVNTNN